MPDIFIKSAKPDKTMEEVLKGVSGLSLKSSRKWTTEEQIEYKRRVKSSGDETLVFDPEKDGSFEDWAGFRPSQIGQDEGIRAVRVNKIQKDSSLEMIGLVEAQGGKESLEMIIQCTVCLSLPLCKIYQCHDGHLVCVDCYRNLPKPVSCPTCRIPMPAIPIRNRVAEQVKNHLTHKTMIFLQKEKIYFSDSAQVFRGWPKEGKCRH